ncbi:MAG: hypothetical protein K6G92_08740 [Bacteroidaceae bacterium]|nr:hypothetical protein [Bacteroidaceae bacterium]
MNRNRIISAFSSLLPSVGGALGWVFLALLLCLSACSEHEGTGDDIDVPTVPVKLIVALPQRIVGTKKPATRMTEEVVQEGQDAENFRGIDDVRMLCFKTYPTENSYKSGQIIQMNSLANDAVHENSDEDYTVNQDVEVPVGTTHFSFYGRAADAPRTHEERMHFGIIETVGLNRSSYNGNNGIRFRPVPICNSTEPCGGSPAGQALLGLLNDLVTMRSTEPAPEDRWSTAGNMYLEESFKTISAMRTLSSFSVQYVLGKVWMVLNMMKDGMPGYELCSMLIQKIEDSCGEVPDPKSDKIVLDERFQGFPDDIHLPAGAARVFLNTETWRFEEPAVQAYGKKLDVAAMSDYAYPMNLHYQVISDLVASDSLVLPETLAAIAEQQAGEGTGGDNQNPTGGDNQNPTSGDNQNPTGGDDQNPTGDGSGDQTGSEETNSQYQGWQNLLDSVYVDASPVVKGSTQSVAMVQQIQYAVGQLALRARLENGTLYDARGKAVDVSNGFTLKGYIIGGQREVDYAFQPVEGSREYAIYDTDINGGPQLLKRNSWTKFNYILGLSTAHDGKVYLAMELVNNGDDFQGADGIILHGATFYLTASMVPSEGTNYNAGTIDQIFRKDHATEVNLKVMNGWPDKDGDGKPDPDLDQYGNPKPPSGLATATYGVPDILVPHSSFGLSVDLIWREGMTFEDVPL